MRARAVLLVVLLLWAGAAAAQPDPRRRLTAFDVVSALPASLGGLVRQGEVTDFESRPGGTGLGASVNYRPGDGRVGLATVYYYDGASPPRPNPPGLTAEDAERQLQSALRDIENLARERRYRVAGTLRSAPILAADGRPAMGCARMLLIYQDGHRAESFTCVGVIGLRFLKLRMTLPVEGKGLAMEEASLAATPMREAEVTTFGAAALAAVVERLR
jgi:hypothetical protein